jgi:hypothetical protein
MIIIAKPTLNIKPGTLNSPIGQKKEDALANILLYIVE